MFRLAAHLRHRIARRYSTVTKTISIGAITFPFTRVTDPDKVLDEVAAEESRLEKISGVRASEDQLHLPYWAEVWDSGMGIAQHLARQIPGSKLAPVPVFNPLNPEPRTLNPLSVLDLGCGMGLAGTAAAAMGHRVTFADLEAPALLFARLNSMPWGDRVRTRRLDWKRDRIDETFDLILGADILYEKKQWPFLEPFWRAHLAEGGRVLLGEPGRQTGDLFIEWMAALPWRLTRHAEKVETRAQPIRLFELQPVG